MIDERATIGVDRRDGEPIVRIARNALVPEAFWLKAQSEWSSLGGSISATRIEVAVSTFLGRLEWLAPYCRQHGVKIDWQGSALALVERRLLEKTQLAAALNGPVIASGPDALEALTRGRCRRELKDFQLRDLAKLLMLPHGANFSVPGAGKTTVAYATYEASRVMERVQQLLVVCPISAFDAWTTEAELTLSPSPTIEVFVGTPIGSAEVLLVNYQRLESGYPALATWVSRKPTQVILDEAHRMKRGWSGEWGRNCLNLAQLAVRRDILTGTPAPHSVTDLYALFDFVWPGQSHLLFSDPQRRDPAAIQLVADRIKPLFARTTKSELGLTPPVVRIEERPLEGLHDEIYTAIRGRYRGSFSLSRSAGIDLRSLGQVIMYLLEAATNPALLVAGSDRYDPVPFRHPPLDIPLDSRLDELLQNYHDYEEPWKLRRVRDLVAENARRGRKTVLWSNFVRSLETLKSNTLHSFGPAIIHGGVVDRQFQLNRFRSDADCWVLLANPAATGEGISLHQVCHDAIYLERTFNAGQYLQSVDRIHRLGLDEDQPTRVTILSSEETIDSVVNQRILQKTETLSRLMDDPSLRVMSLEADYEDGLDDADDTGIDNIDARDVIRHLT